MNTEGNVEDWSPKENAAPENEENKKKPKKLRSKFFSSASQSSYNASESGISEDTDSKATGGKSRLKFSKARSIHKSVSQAYMKQLNAAKPSKFAGWTKAELAELLVHFRISPNEADGIHIRNEVNLDLVVLRDMADQLFADKPMPEKPTLPTLEELVLRNVMARRIQDAWIEYQYQKRETADFHKSMYYQKTLEHIASRQDVHDIGKAELLYMSLEHEDLIGGRDFEIGHLHYAEENKDDEAHLAITSQPKNESFLLEEGKKDVETGTIARKPRHNVLDVPWTPPNIERALKYADYVQPRKGGKGGKVYDYINTSTGRHCCLGGLGEQFDLWEEGRISEFSIYGPGVTNYFKFMKFAIWLFIALTVAALPMLVLNSVPSNGKTNVGLKQLASTTIGNLAITLVNGTLSVPVPGCDSFALLGSTCNFNGRDLALLYASLDILISVVVFIGFIWLSLFEQYEEIELHRSTIKASMYTIVVSNLPDEVTEVDILNHFGTIVGRKDAISSISLAYNNADEIHLCRKRGDIIRQKIKLVHSHRRECTNLNQSSSPQSEEEKNVLLVKKREVFFQEMKELNASLSNIEKQLEEISKKELKVVYAFVTFNKSTDRDVAFNAYNRQTIYHYFFHYEHLQLNGKLLIVKAAPEPSVIIWENLQFSHWERYKRRALTTFFSLLCIVLSLSMIFSSKYLQEKAANNGYSKTTVCPTDFFTWTDATQEQYVEENPSYLHCYCDQFSTLNQARNSECRSYLQSNIDSQVLVYFSSFIVLVVNMIITQLLRYNMLFEKHHSGDGQSTSIFLRLFILKYINSAGVFLINNNNDILRKIFGITTSSAPSFTANWYNTVAVTIILVQLGNIFTGNIEGIVKLISYYWRRNKAIRNPELFLTQERLNQQFVGAEFEFAFNYAQIITTLFVTLTFSTGIPLLYPIAAANFLFTYWIEKFLFIFVYKIPPHFNTVVGRRASGLIPLAILIHIALAIWMLSNKSIFTDGNGSDSSTSSGGNSVTDIPEYYYSSSTNDVQYDTRERVTQTATLPLFILFFILLGIWMLMYLTQFVSFGLEKIYTLYLGCITKPDPDGHKSRHIPKALKVFQKAQEGVTYVRAVKRNLIKGLATYNILQNPVYKEAFGITWKFAVDHKDVRSVRKLKLKAQNSAIEDDAAEIESFQRNALSATFPAKLHHIHAGDGKKKRPSNADGGSATSEGSRLSVKSVTKNRSFYGSFYEQQPADKIILQIDTNKELQNILKQDKASQEKKNKDSGVTSKKKKGPNGTTPTKKGHAPGTSAVRPSSVASPASVAKGTQSTRRSTEKKSKTPSPNTTRNGTSAAKSSQSSQGGSTSRSDEQTTSFTPFSSSNGRTPIAKCNLSTKSTSFSSSSSFPSCRSCTTTCESWRSGLSSI